MALARVILDGLERCLHAHAGLDLPSWVVETRAVARMSVLALEPQAYLDLVSGPHGAAELSALVEAVRVGETRFFRHRPQVNAVLEVVVPAWRARDERRLRVWSAGCATGEEAYTLALVLSRALPPPKYTISILATDVSFEALAVARRATYPSRAVEEVPEPWRAGLIDEGGSVRVRPEVASLVGFERQNLADAVSPRGFDLVWCRNVLIYFGPEARRRVLAKLVAALRPGGFLFVGYSETLRDVAGLRSLRHGEQVLYQKVTLDAPAPAPRPLEKAPSPPVTPPGARAARRPAEPARDDTGRAAVLPGEPRNRLSSLPGEAGSRVPGVPGEAGSRVPGEAGNRVSGVPGEEGSRASRLSGEMGSRASSLPAEPRNRASSLPSEPGNRASSVPTEPGNRRSWASPEPRSRASSLPGEPASRAPLLPRSPGPAAARQAVPRRAEKRISAANPGTLAGEIRSALAVPGLGTLTIDLDAAEYLDDDVAPVLKRAVRAAQSAGITLVLVATRPGPQRWLRRNGLAGGDG